LLVSCSESALAQVVAPPVVEQAHALSDDVWITTSRDSVELVQRVVGSARRLERRDGPAHRDEVALRVPRAALPDISDAQHTEHHRCGGFMLQDSEAETMATLAAPDTLPNLLFLAPAYSIDNAATVDKLLPEAKEPNVLATIRKLSAYRNRFHTSATGEEAALYIRDTWQALAAGRADVVVELVDHEKTPQPSVKLTLRGSSLPNEIVVLGGHLDSISGRGSASAIAPGADDNASGIAVLTEMLRAAIALDYRPARSLVFYGYAAEEIGLVGSAEIAARAKADALNVVGVLQLDMTNFTSAPVPFIGLVTDFTDKTLTEFSAQLIDQYLHVPYKYFACGYACSDHASWNKSGFPATAPHEADNDTANDRIHTSADTLALSKDSAVHSMHFVRFGLAFMAEIAKGRLGAELVAPACDGGTCVSVTDAGTSVSGVCTLSADCTTGQVCQSGRCGPELKPAPGCSASTPCATGLACVAGACVVANGASGQPDAGLGPRDASVGPDAGATPPTSTAVQPIVPALDAGAPSASRSAAGCGVATVGPAQSSAWSLWAAALVLVARARRRRQSRA
jgi:leucyl aminopeptidase